MSIPEYFGIHQENLYKTTSPQGDGNFVRQQVLQKQNQLYKTTSPQGDGNGIDNSLTHTDITTLQNHFPARGWKLPITWK